MKIENTKFEGLYVFHPSIFKDERGYFFESFNKNKFIETTNIKTEFVQDNQSFSIKNVLRGLHFQLPPFAQAKLVRVVKGSVIDIVVDIRKKSPTFGQYFTIELNESNNLSVYIPEGFAHGFVTLEDNTLFIYKCSNFYHKESERTIMWNDSKLNIDWKVLNPIISEKDKEGLVFENFNSPF
jgi:dTDP-4-dehydrorhamnose 3,5-epimerase